MERVGAKIGHIKLPLFDDKNPDRVFYSDFVNTNNDDKKLLPYWEDIQGQNEDEANKAYIEALDNYIESKLVVPGKDYKPVLARLKRRKWDALGVVPDPDDNIIFVSTN